MAESLDPNVVYRNGRCWNAVAASLNEKINKQMFWLKNEASWLVFGMQERFNFPYSIDNNNL